MKKDRIFVIVIALILANLVYFFTDAFVNATNNPSSVWRWTLLVADGVAIYGALWLFRSYKKGVRIGKKEAEKEK